MPGPISFKLGMLVVHGWLLMHVIFFLRFDKKWPTGSHFVFCFCTFGMFFNTNCVKVVTEKKHDNIHVHVKFFFDPVVFSRLGGLF